jgi:hypothetical protein
VGVSRLTLLARLRINIGNIYFEQKKYLQAIKMYRMALDQIPNAQLDLKSLAAVFVFFHASETKS